MCLIYHKTNRQGVVANQKEKDAKEALLHLTLEDVIATPQYCSVLEEYLDKNLCSENLAFLQHIAVCFRCCCLVVLLLE